MLCIPKIETIASLRNMSSIKTISTVRMFNLKFSLKFYIVESFSNWPVEFISLKII